MIHIYIDEAGRWPLAGPVYVGLVIATKGWKSLVFKDYKDSKKLSEKQRESLFTQLQQSKIARSYGKSTARYIDTNGIVGGIRQAIISWVKKIISPLDRSQIVLHIDGNTDFGLRKKFPWLIVHTYIKGDDRIAAISAASIIAKILRDHEMVHLDKKYSVYRFAQHKWYGTAMHRAHIARFGLSKEHRKSFCRNILLQK